MRFPSSLRRGLVAAGLLAVGLAILLGTGQHSAGPVSTGPSPKLPEPYAGWPPTLNFSKAEPWPEGAHPNAPPGFKVTRFAANLDHPRWLYALPNGDAKVAQRTHWVLASTTSRRNQAKCESYHPAERSKWRWSSYVS
jgi:glucose/arabinose dehydrogenase